MVLISRPWTALDPEGSGEMSWFKGFDLHGNKSGMPKVWVQISHDVSFCFEAAPFRLNAECHANLQKLEHVGKFFLLSPPLSGYPKIGSSFIREVDWQANHFGLWWHFQGHQWQSLRPTEAQLFLRRQIPCNCEVWGFTWNKKVLQACCFKTRWTHSWQFVLLTWLRPAIGLRCSCSIGPRVCARCKWGQGSDIGPLKPMHEPHLHLIHSRPDTALVLASN